MQFKRWFSLSLVFGLLVFVCFLFFIRLGIWQLRRGYEKKAMVTAAASFSKKKPVEWQGEQPWPVSYQRLRVWGCFGSPILFLDNQHYQHQVGYNVIYPFIVNKKTLLLVDAGWVLGDVRRQQLPQIKIPKTCVFLRGKAYFPPQKHWFLGDMIEKITPQHTVIEYIDTPLISQFLHKPVYPFIIRLDPRERIGFVRKWPIVSMPPARHYAYALQWFALAAVALILVVVLIIKSRDERSLS